MAKTTFGTKFWFGNDPQNLTLFPNMVSISPPTITRNALDVTTHASPQGAQEFIPDGVYDPGELTVTWNGVVSDAMDDMIRAAWLNPSPYSFKWSSKAAAGEATFGPAVGVITSYDPTGALGTSGKQVGTLTVKLSGPAALVDPA